MSFRDLATPDASEHIGPEQTGDNIDAKRSANYIWDGSGWVRQTAAASGGATEYTDGDATTANPVGGIQVFDNAGTITAVSDSNPLPVSASVNASITFGETSTNNSTTTPLASGATFTGTGEQNDYANVGVMVKTDNTGTLYFDFSNDGSNWDSTFPVNGFDVVADVSEFHTAVKLGRYFRVRLVNDTGAQSYLRLTTYYGQNFLPSAAPLNQSINDDSDAIISRSVLVGKNDSGSYDNVGITDKGELKVGQDADIDANNSTTTPLGGSATFTGTGTDVSGYGGITVTLFADRDSTANGMKFQFSTDNTNWDLDIAGGFDYVGSTGRQFQFATQAKYFRVVFENGAVAQSALRIQTLLHKNPPTITSIHRAADNVKPDRSATLVKSVLMGQVNGSGDLVPVQLSAAGILKTTGSAGGVTDTAYAEDSASGSGDVGSFVLAVRRDTATSGTSADGDYASLNVDSTGRLWTNVSNTVSVEEVNNAYVDTNNSSSATLGSGGIFTGTATDLTGITNIGIFVRSDVASATNGLEIQFSTDNSTWYTDESYTIAAATEKTFSQGRIARYFRIKYTNGGTAQSSFNLQTTLFTGGRPKPSSHKLESTPISQDDAELVKAQLVAQQPGGAFTNIDATTGGNLKVSVQEISDGLDVGAGAAGAETQRVILASDQTVVPVSDNGGSLTVDGTVTANLSATDNAVLDDIAANQTDNSQKTQIVDAAGNAVTVTGNKLDVNATASLAGTTLPISGASDAVGVAIVDGSGNQITSFGGGTQYADGDAVATPTGTAALGFDGTNVQALATDASGNLQVDVLNSSIPVTDNGGSLTVDGTVAVSSSALPTGAATAANQQTDALTDTELRATPVVVDLGANNDVTVSGTVAATQSGSWSLAANQSVNVAQMNGVATTMGNGASGTGVQRVTIASDSTGVIIARGAAAVDAAVSGNPVYTGGRASTATPTAVSADGDAQSFWLTRNGALNIADAGGSITVDGTVGVSGTVTVDGSGVTQPVSAASLPLPTGAATAANQQTDALTDTELRASPVVVDLGANNDVTVSGTVTANLSATDNAVLDTIASNTGKGSSATLADVAGSATSVTLLASNASRIEATITNDSTADLYVKLGATASTTSYTVKLGQDESYVTDKYTGVIDGIWSSATGNARVTEI